MIKAKWRENFVTSVLRVVAKKICNICYLVSRGTPRIERLEHATRVTRAAYGARRPRLRQRHDALVTWKPVEMNKTDSTTTSSTFENSLEQQNFMDSFLTNKKLRGRERNMNNE